MASSMVMDYKYVTENMKYGNLSTISFLIEVNLKDLFFF